MADHWENRVCNFLKKILRSKWNLILVQQRRQHNMKILVKWRIVWLPLQTSLCIKSSTSEEVCKTTQNFWSTPWNLVNIDIRKCTYFLVKGSTYSDFWQVSPWFDICLLSQFIMFSLPLHQAEFLTVWKHVGILHLVLMRCRVTLRRNLAS